MLVDLFQHGLDTVLKMGAQLFDRRIEGRRPRRQEPENPWHAVPLDRVGTNGFYEGPVSSSDLAKGVWSGEMPSTNSDGSQA